MPNCPRRFIRSTSTHAMIGGLTTSFIMEPLIYPVIFYLAKDLAEFRRGRPAAGFATIGS